MTKLMDYPTDVTCPKCGYHFDIATPVGHNAPPKDGDVSVCINCAEVMTFEGGKLRPLTDTERAELDANPIASAYVNKLVSYLKHSPTLRAHLRTESQGNA